MTTTKMAMHKLIMAQCPAFQRKEFLASGIVGVNEVERNWNGIYEHVIVMSIVLPSCSQDGISSFNFFVAQKEDMFSLISSSCNLDSKVAVP